MSESHVSHVFTMPNSLQVVTVHRPWGKSFAAALMYRVGTFDDPIGVPGTAHFAEHLAFAGENKDLVARIAVLGTKVNGRTGYDYTEFATAGHVDDLELSLEFLANILRNRVVTDEDIANERDVFFHELEDEDDPSSREDDLDSFWRRSVGDPNWRTSQTKSSVKTKLFAPNGLNSFKQQYYHPANARLAIVSPLDCEELRRQIDHCLPRGSAAEPVPEFRQRDDPLNARSLTISWDLKSYVWVDVMHSVRTTTLTMRLTANMIGHLLGGGPHSELFQRLRTERGIAYHTNSDDLPYLSCTAMHCFFSVPKRSIDEALSFVIDRVNEIAARGITEGQLESEKLRMIRWHDMEMDHPRGLSSYLAYEALRPSQSGTFQPDSYRRAAASLTLPEVNQAASELLSTRNRATFVGGRIGPFARIRIKRRLARR